MHATRPGRGRHRRAGGVAAVFPRCSTSDPGNNDQKSASDRSARRDRRRPPDFGEAGTDGSIVVGKADRTRGPQRDIGDYKDMVGAGIVRPGQVVGGCRMPHGGRPADHDERCDRPAEPKPGAMPHDHDGGMGAWEVSSRNSPLAQSRPCRLTGWTDQQSNNPTPRLPAASIQAKSRV